MIQQMFRRRLAVAATLLVLPALLTAFQTPPSKGTPAPRVAKPAAKPAAKGPAKTPALPPIKNAPGQAWTESLVTVPIIGHVTAYVPKTPASTVMLFLSGDGRWNLGVIDWARRIMPKAIVLGVDFVALKNAHPTSGTCWLPTGDLETISHAAQRALKLPEYHPPILVGYSSGATLVYEALAAAPPNTFSGGVSLGFCPDLPALQPVCPAENFRPTYDPKKYTAWLPKVTDLKHDWYVLNGELDQVCLPPETHKFLDGMQGAHFIEIPHTGHGFGKQQFWSQPFDESIDALIKAATAPKAAAPAPRSAAGLESRLDALNLPLEYRWAEPSRAAVIFISGDGGWATIDDKLAAYLASHGVSVVGISSLRYFWNVKTPQQTGADLQRIAATLQSANLPLFVGGYSFGAEVTPFILGTWPDAERRTLAGQILIGPGETASFEISPMDWVFRAKETPRRVADEVRTLRVSTFCLSGQQEEARDTACDEVAGVAESVRLPGSHHFNGKYDDVGRVVLAFIDKQLKARQ
jgi:type IV secretory pathway VirJ component